MNNDERTLDVSCGTILKIAFVFLGFYILYLVKDILVWVIFASVISILFNPAINFLHEKGIPRAVSAIFIYVAVFAILI